MELDGDASELTIASISGTTCVGFAHHGTNGATRILEAHVSGLLFGALTLGRSEDALAGGHGQEHGGKYCFQHDVDR